MCGCSKAKQATTFSYGQMAPTQASGPQIALADSNNSQTQAISELGASKDPIAPVSSGRTSIVYPKRGPRVRIDLR